MFQHFIRQDLVGSDEKWIQKFTSNDESEQCQSNGTMAQRYFYKGSLCFARYDVILYTKSDKILSLTVAFP